MAIINRASQLTATCLLFALTPEDAHAYHTNDNWCNAFDLGIYLDQTTFVNRGIDASAIYAATAVGAAWWSEVQAGLRFTTPIVGPNFQNDIMGLCDTEDSNLTGETMAYTHMYYWWHPSCDFWGVNNDNWYMRVKTNDGTVCGDGSAWGTTRADWKAGKSMLYKSISHEFGHVFGLAHSDYFGTLMYEWDSPNARQMNDDADGIVYGLNEGFNSTPLRTASATYRSPYSSLVFNSTKTVSTPTNLLWGPAIAGDPYSATTGRDYALAWVDTSLRIVVATAKESAGDALQIFVASTTNEYSRAPVAVAVSPSGTIGLAWGGADSPKTVNFMTIEYLNGTEHKTTFWGQWAMGGVNVVFDNNVNRWVLS